MAPLKKGAFLFAYVKKFFILGNVTRAFAVCLRRVKINLEITDFLLTFASPKTTGI